MSEHRASPYGERRKEPTLVGPIGRQSPDPAFPRVTKLVGLHLGNSPQRAYWRLYLTPTFDRYLQFRKKDTLDAKRLSTGRIVVWLTPNAKLEEVAAGAPEEFLRGDLQSHLDRVSRWSGIRRILALEDGTCNGGGGGGSISVTHCEGGSCTSPGMPGCSKCSIDVCPT
jgi:hypothetical protein